jgi:hypothetical protein
MRLPHEHDELGRQPATSQRRVIQKAHEDVTSGRVDTDERGLKAARSFARISDNTAPVRTRKGSRSRP